MGVFGRNSEKFRGQYLICPRVFCGFAFRARFGISESAVKALLKPRQEWLRSQGAAGARMGADRRKIFRAEPGAAGHVAVAVAVVGVGIGPGAGHRVRAVRQFEIWRG